MTASRIGATDASRPESAVSAGDEALVDLADALQAEHAAGGCVPLLIVLLAEVVEVALEDRMELIAAARDIVLRRGRGRGNGGAHTDKYGPDGPVASGRWRNQRSPHNLKDNLDDKPHIATPEEGIEVMEIVLRNWLSPFIETDIYI